MCISVIVQTILNSNAPPSSSLPETPHMDPKRLPGEKDLCVTTMLEGVQVTLGDILTANVTGKQDRSTPPIVEHLLYFNL